MGTRYGASILVSHIYKASCRRSQELCVVYNFSIVLKFIGLSEFDNGSTGDKLD